MYNCIIARVFISKHSRSDFDELGSIRVSLSGCVRCIKVSLSGCVSCTLLGSVCQVCALYFLKEKEKEITIQSFFS
jgi:hypothetical protein